MLTSKGKVFGMRKRKSEQKSEVERRLLRDIADRMLLGSRRLLTWGTRGLFCLTASGIHSGRYGPTFLCVPLKGTGVQVRVFSRREGLESQGSISTFENYRRFCVTWFSLSLFKDNDPSL